MAQANTNRSRLSQSYYRIKNRVPLSQLLHLGNWDFKLYALLIEKADAQTISDGEWIWKPFNLHEVIGISQSTFAKAISNLKSLNLRDTSNQILIYGEDYGEMLVVGTHNGKVEVKPKTKKDGEEAIVKNRLKDRIGGTPEVITPAGRIDLLTDSEVIEVKRIDEWKSALGQVLAYSAFLPNHTKRIHLFGTAQQLQKLLDIEAACLTFDVLVTGEEV